MMRDSERQDWRTRGGDELPHYVGTLRADYAEAEDPEARWITLNGGDLPCPIAVRLGRADSGRLCFTGLRMPPDSTYPPAEVNSKMLRQISLGNVMRYFRESAARGIGSWPDVLRDVAEPTRLTVPRGPKGDPETDQRTLECYEAALRRGLAGIAAVAEVSEELHVSLSQVYRRVRRARDRAARKETER